MSLVEARKLGLPEAESIYQEIIKQDTKKSEKAIQNQEAAFLDLGAYYRESKQVDKLAELVAIARDVTSSYAKSKTAKILKVLIDEMHKIPGTIEQQIETIQQCIDWSIKENRSFLRQSLQVRLVALYYDQKSYQKAIELIGSLLKELKRLDDKMMLVEVQLLESRVYHALRNLPRARASLTSARTSANSVYTPTLMQAQLDQQSGMLQAEEGDYKTSFSYFYEAFEGYASINDTTAVSSLKYLLLVKIMLNLTADVEQLLSHKNVQQYGGRDIDAMKAMARASDERSLKEFESVLKQFPDELAADPFIRSHFTALYDKLFQENLVKLIEPYSCVEIVHLAQLLELDSQHIEAKLSQMILDKVISGVLDQGNGWLYVYEPPVADVTYSLALETMKHMSSVVDILYEKASAIN